MSVPSSLALAVAFPSTTYEHVALLIAREFDPTVDVAARLADLDALAEPLARELPRGAGPVEQALVLAEHVAVKLGIVGDRETYDDPDNSFLPRVLARRRGLPITLSVLYAALGRRAGVEVDGIGFPGHFLVRVGGVGGVLQDPFHGGRCLDEEALRLLAHQHLGPGVAIPPEVFRPVDVVSLALRILNNLRRSYERRGALLQAFVAADRACSVLDHPDAVRIRGELALRQGWGGLAMRDLEQYLARAPHGADANRVRGLLGQARRLGGAGVAN